MTLVEQIAQQRLTIEKIASEVSREILREPAFKEELKAVARQSLGRAFRDLRANNGRTKRKTR